MFENVDGRRTDERTTDGILLAHQWAFGSGELKIMKNYPVGKELFILTHISNAKCFRNVTLSAGSDKIHAKSKFLSTWWLTDFSKNYTVGRYMDLLFSPNLFFLKSFALLRKSGLYFLTIILTFSLKSTKISDIFRNLCRRGRQCNMPGHEAELLNYVVKK